MTHPIVRRSSAAKATRASCNSFGMRAATWVEIFVSVNQRPRKKKMLSTLSNVLTRVKRLPKLVLSTLSTI